MLDKNSRVSSTGYFAEDLPEAMLARNRRNSARGTVSF